MSNKKALIMNKRNKILKNNQKFMAIWNLIKHNQNQKIIMKITKKIGYMDKHKIVTEISLKKKKDEKGNVKELDINICLKRKKKKSKEHGKMHCITKKKLYEKLNFAVKSIKNEWRNFNASILTIEY